jgi:hypothetical protein
MDETRPRTTRVFERDLQEAFVRHRPGTAGNDHDRVRAFHRLLGGGCNRQAEIFVPCFEIRFRHVEHQMSGHSFARGLVHRSVPRIADEETIQQLLRGRRLREFLEEKGNFAHVGHNQSIQNVE